MVKPLASSFSYVVLNTYDEPFHQNKTGEFLLQKATGKKLFYYTKLG